MKHKIIILLGVLGMSLVTTAQRGVRIGYVDMEYILENVEEYREATEQLDKRVNQWKSEIEAKQRLIEQEKKDLLAERVLLTDELILEREEEIQIMEKELLDYQQARFGPRGDLVLQKQRLIQPIQDQVFNEVQKIGANKKYDFIFDKSADVVMLYSEKRHDISDLILRGIARTRRVSKPQKKADDRLEQFEGDDEIEESVSEALLERQTRAAEAEEARQKAAADKRSEALKLREERKKAYEARRKKLLEEREARRKAKEEERKQATEKEKDSIN